MILFSIRHLPTSWNDLDKIQGSQDIPIKSLEPNTHDDIQHNRRLLQNISFDAVLTSRLIRTKQTARAYAMLHYTVEPLLDELNFGTFETKDKATLLTTLGEAWAHNPLSLTLGESMVNFQNRLQQFIQKYLHTTHVLVFGHGAWIRGMLSLIKVGDISQMNKIIVENNSLSIVDIHHETFV